MIIFYCHCVPKLFFILCCYFCAISCCFTLGPWNSLFFHKYMVGFPPPPPPSRLILHFHHLIATFPALFMPRCVFHWAIFLMSNVKKKTKSSTYFSRQFLWFKIGTFNLVHFVWPFFFGSNFCWFFYISRQFFCMFVVVFSFYSSLHTNRNVIHLFYFVFLCCFFTFCRISSPQIHNVGGMDH